MRGLSSLLEGFHPLAQQGDGAGAAEVLHAHGLDGLLVVGGIEFGERLGPELLESFFHGGGVNFHD